jgi:YD repeat-containing protein
MDGTLPGLQYQSRAYYDSTPQNASVCTPLEWTPRNFLFTDSCASVGKAWNATFGGCAAICVAPDTLNTQTGLCEPESVPPSVPTNLSSVPMRAAMTLTWSASTDNVAVTGYAVERCLGAACSDFAAVATTAGTTYPDSGLASNTMYRYRARAFDAAGNHSAYSAIAEATTPAISAEYLYDELGRVVLVTLASGASIVYAYDESGNVSAIVRAAP